MAIKKSLLGINIPLRPARVLKCLDVHLAFHETCGYRCVCWVHALRYDDYTVGGNKREKVVNGQMAAIYQLSAELCETTPLPLRGAVSDALKEVYSHSVDKLLLVAERARFMLTTPDRKHKLIAASLLGTFPGTAGEFEETVVALAANEVEAPAITCRGMNPDPELTKLPR